MKSIVKVIATIALLLCMGRVSAQNTNSSFGGITLNNDVMLTSDFATLSTRQAFGTARSMAMGNAFTSLGGDVASMSINPAGLGMYRSDHFSFTPMITIASASTANTASWQGNKENGFTIGNLGLVMNVFQGKSASGGLVSISFGFALNRVADYNYKYSYTSLSEYGGGDELAPTIADIFAQQLGAAGVYPDSSGRLGYTTTDPYLWPAVMGYNGYMISALSDSEGSYWTPDTIGSNASVAHGMQCESSGSITEYLFSAGVNLSNFLYVGATLGIESVRQDRILTYQEEYIYSSYPQTSSGDALVSYLDYANIWQRCYVKGVGVNFKIGAIIRPFEALRIGIAYHTPTVYDLERSYQGDIESILVNSSAMEFNSSNTGTLYDDGSNSWDFTSPSRLLLGASLTMGTRGVISLDYERAWYNAINVTNIPYNTGFSIYDYNNEAERAYQPTNTFRAGLEVKPLPALSLRAGGGYTTSMVKDESAFYSSMTPTTSQYIGGGVGLFLGQNTTLDLTYQNYLQHYTSYQLFYSEDGSGDFITSSGSYETEIRNHYIVATLGFKF